MSTPKHMPAGPTIGLHFKRYPEVDVNIYDNALLVEALGGLGVSSVLIPNIQAYDLGEGTVQALPLGIDRNSEIPAVIVKGASEKHDLGVEGINTIRARVGIAKQLEDLVAVVNDSETRNLGIDKWQQYELARDFMPVTRKLEKDEAIKAECLESIPGDKIVIKKSGGGESRWLTVCAKNLPMASQAIKDMRSRIADKLKENPGFRQDFIVQEFVPARKIDGLTPIDDDEKVRYQTLGGNGHELRFYCFANGDPTKTCDYYATLRAFDEGKEDEWIFIDQDRLPTGSVLLAEQISSRFIKKTASKGAFIAVDLFQGQRAADDQPRWLVREINAKDPIMASSSRSLLAAREQRAKLAQLLADLTQIKPRVKI